MRRPAPVEIPAAPRKDGRRFFRFAYPLKKVEPGEAAVLQDLRDADAFLEIASALERRGYEYGGLVLNLEGSPHAALARAWRASDLVVVTTRPPLDDDPNDRRPIPRSGTPLEKMILRAMRERFDVCSRSFVRLAEGMAKGLANPDRGEIKFHTYGGSTYKEFRSPRALGVRAESWNSPEGTKATAAYLVRARLWPNGPTLLNVFGMSAVTTLLWCYLVRTRFPHLLGCDFAMAEICTEPIPLRPASLSFADGWKVEILHPAGPVPAPRPSSR